MHRLIKILGSIFTSFLFILLTILLALDTICLVVRVTHKDLTDMIDVNSLYSYVTDNENLPIKEKEVIIKYLKEYINYVFYRRSYPTISYSELEYKDKFIKKVENVRYKIDLDYEVVIIIRNVNNFISNNSVFLIINILIFVTYLLLCIRYLDFYKGIYIFNNWLLLDSLLILMGTIWLYKYINISTFSFKTLLLNIYNQNLINVIFRIDMYLFITTLTLSMIMSIFAFYRKNSLQL